MATFLAIYSKVNAVREADVADVLHDFSLQGTRPLVTAHFQGMLFSFAAQFQTCFHQSQTAFSFVSGHIAFDALQEQPAGNSEAEKFNALIASGKQDAVPLLEGAFAALQYEQHTHTLTFVNDKFGIFPLFLFENKEYIILSNEYQPLMHLPAGKQKELDYDAIAEFYTLGTTLGNKTFFKHLKNTSPATFAVAKHQQVTLKRYWKPAEAGLMDHTVDASLLAEEILACFTKVNREYTDARLAEVTLLTAGADSRLIVSTLTEAQLAAGQFYTSNLSFLDPLLDKDVVGARLLAERFQLQHQVEKISFYENPFDGSFFDTERALRKSHIYGGWHGGEFLGGYALKAAPVNRELSYKEVHAALKTIFSWKFRWKLSVHPYRSYVREKSRGEFLFLAEQMTRSFFTTIYGGSRGHWVQPYQLMNHGFSPFWDSRFLQKLLQVPLSLLKDYGFYNEVFKRCEASFTEIPSNSPLTNRTDSVIPKMELGLEPKLQLPNTHHRAYLAWMQDFEKDKPSFYNKTALKKILQKEQHPLTMRWLDFEVWYHKYIH